MIKRQISNNNTFSIPQCNTCKHKRKGLSCASYAIIPDEILMAEFDHTAVFGGEKKIDGKEILYEREFKK